MSDIKAGIVIMNQYSHPQSKSFGSYVDYIDRKEAVRKENDFKYNLFNEYMGNPEKVPVYLQKKNGNSMKRIRKN